MTPEELIEVKIREFVEDVTLGDFGRAEDRVRIAMRVRDQCQVEVAGRE